MDASQVRWLHRCEDAEPTHRADVPQQHADADAKPTRADAAAHHMSNPFVQRVANWLAQEVVVKGSRENKALPALRLWTDHKLKELMRRSRSKVTEAANNLAKEASKAAESVSATVQREMQ